MTVIDTSLTDESTPLLEENDIDEQIPVKKISFENGSLLRNASILTCVIITGLNVYLIIAFANGADI